MKITIALVILFTYGLQMTAPMKVVWDEVRPYIKEHPSRYYYGIRAALIIGNGKFVHHSIGNRKENGVYLVEGVWS